MNEASILNQNATERHLAVVGYGLFGMWIIRLIFDPLERLDELPLSVFHPPAPVLFFPESWREFLMSAQTLLIFRLVTIGVLGLAAFRVCFLATGVLSCVALTVYQSIVRGYGHINHAEIVPLLGIYILTAFACADKVERTKRPSYPIVAIILMLSLSYMFVGVHRLGNGGLAIFFTNGIDRSAVLNSMRVSWFQFGMGDLLLESRFVRLGLRMGFIAVTLVEILAPMCLVSRRFRIVFLIIIVPFHVMTILTMHIAFFENLVLLGLLIEFPRSNVNESHQAKLPGM